MALQLKDILIMCILVSMVGIGMASFILEQAQNHGVSNIDTSFNTTFNLLPEMTNASQDIRQAVLSGSVISVDGFTALFNGGLAVMKLVLNTLTLPLQILVAIFTALGLPDWVGIGITGILTLVVCFIIINAILGRGKA